MNSEDHIDKQEFQKQVVYELDRINSAILKYQEREKHLLSQKDAFQSNFFNYQTQVFNCLRKRSDIYEQLVSLSINTSLLIYTDVLEKLAELSIEDKLLFSFYPLKIGDHVENMQNDGLWRKLINLSGIDTYDLTLRKETYKKIQQRSLLSPFLRMTPMQNLVNVLRKEDDKILRKYQEVFNLLSSELIKTLDEQLRIEIAHLSEVRKGEINAELIIKRNDIRKYICPPLQSVSNDMYEIAKIITPILLSLTLAGTITVPLQPLLFAHIAVLVARMGIASLCSDYKPEKKSE